jgi:hypothetical protein
MGLYWRINNMKDMNLGDWENRKDCSDKNCCCGCHNANNPSRNLNHNSTKQKYLYRLSRLFKKKEKN